MKMLKFFFGAALLVTVSASCVEDTNGKCKLTIVPYKIARLAHSDKAVKLEISGMYDTLERKMAVAKAALEACAEVMKLDIDNLMELTVHFKYRLFNKAIFLLHDTANGLFAHTIANERIRNNEERSNVVFAEYLTFLETYYSFLMRKLEFVLNGVLNQYQYELTPGIRRQLAQLTLRAELEKSMPGEFKAPMAERIAAFEKFLAEV